MAKATPSAAARRPPPARAVPVARRWRVAWRRGYPWALLAVTALALGLRLVGGAQLFASFPPAHHFNASTDMFTYDEYARQILAGTYFQADHGDFHGFYYQPLYYAVFLPLVYAVSHGSVFAVIVVQSLLGAATVWLVGWSFSRLAGRSCGLLAAALLALSRMHLFYGALLQVEVLQGFWLALWLAVALWAYRRRARPRAALAGWAACGLVAGLATLTRGNMVLLLPVPLLVVAWSYRRQARWALAGAALVLTLWYLPQLPFALVNYRLLGHWTGPSSAGGSVLALGNTPEAPPGGRDPGSGAGAMEYPLAFREWMKQDGGDGTPRVSVGANLTRWIAREPLAWAELKWRTLLLFWDHDEIPNNVALPLPAQRGGATLVNFPLLLDFALLGGLGLGGLALALGRRWRHPGWWLAVGLAALYSLSIVLFYMLERFRLAAYPLICGGAAYMVVVLAWRVRTRLRRGGQVRLLLTLLVCLAGLLTVAVGSTVYRVWLEARVLQVARPRGVAMDLVEVVAAQDHGPHSFGGWAPLPLHDALPTEKRFCLPRPRATTYQRAELHLVLADLAPPATPPAEVIVEVSCGGQPVGRAQLAVVAAKGLQEVDVPLTLAALPTNGDDCTLLLTWHAASPTVAALLDRQRQYGRTRAGGQELPGELVATLRLWK